MMPAGAKKILMLGLVSCFVVQTWLVYSDQPSGVQLTGEALHGARLWHRYNCQSCHQLYGFGGFLGPDLTNIAARLEKHGLRQRLAFVLQQGSGQMPAFEVDQADISALNAFLLEMNRTGYGQLRLPAAPAGKHNPLTRFEGAIEAEMGLTPPAEARAGYSAFQTRQCQVCHTPLSESPVGAPDLSTVAARLDRKALHEVLSKGRMPKMPPPTLSLSEQQREQIIAFLTWLGENREVLAKRLARGSDRRFAWSDIPWWEYR